MNSHVLIVAGAAGSGKDTVAGFIQRHFSGRVLLVAQAGPMKEFAKRLLGFTDEQLYGPSECRNARDPRFDVPNHRIWADAFVWLNNLSDDGGDKWLKDILAKSGSAVSFGEARTKLWSWFDTCRAYCEKNGTTPRYVLQTFGTEFGRFVHEDIWSNIAISTCRTGLVKGDCDLAVITDGRFRNEVLNVLGRGGTAIRVVNPEGTDGTTATAGAKNHQSEAELGGIPDHFFTAILVNNKTNGLSYLEQQASYAMSRMFQSLVVAG